MAQDSSFSAAALAALLIFIAGCSTSDGSENGPPAGTLVVVEPARLGTVDHTERSMAPSEAQHRPAVSAEVAGRIELIVVDVGDRVDEDALLARLDRAPYQFAHAEAEAQVASLDARVTQLQNQLNRIRHVGDGQYVSAADLDAAEAQLESARQDLSAAVNRRDEARRRLEKTDIRAPSTGRIDARMVSEGDYLGEGDAAFRILPDATNRVRLPFPERAGDRLEEGMAVMLRRLGRDEGETLEGRLTRIRPSVSGSMAVVAVVEFEAPENWQPGTMLEGRVLVERRHDAVLVPTMSVVDRPGRKVVFVLPGDADHGVVEERVVTLGHRSANETEILNGVVAGERIVVDGAPFIDDGVAVRARDDR